MPTVADDSRLFALQNHAVWETGEPAFLKWYIGEPATLLGGAALQREEGLQQHYVAGAVEAYLAECGVQMSRCDCEHALAAYLHCCCPVIKRMAVSHVGCDSCHHCPMKD